jgi:hypothetical protein
MVSATKLHAAERLIDELDPSDRIRLLQYLAPRIAEAVLPTPATTTPQVDQSWQRLREVGQRIAAAAAKDPSGPSMTELVSEMRR